MKVWELCNKVKGTNVSKRQIEDWAYSNRICPLMFDVGLEIDVELEEDGYIKENEFSNTAHKICDGKCGVECLRKYLDTEVEKV